MIAKLPRVSALGIDTIEPLTDAHLDEITADPRIEFVGQYVDNLTAERLAAILDRGLLVTLFTFAGEFDPMGRIAKLLALKVPAGVTIWLDVEDEKILAVDLVSRITRWGNAIKTAGFDPGEYAGAGELLTSGELTALPVDRYAHSCSSVRDRVNLIAEPASGYCFFQGFPPNAKIRPESTSDLIVDWDVVFEDYRGRLPTMIGKAA